MPAIFFDLETSDSEFIGQILNFSFIVVDDDWKEIAELSSTVKISRLELPSPGAILANRTDVLRHQTEAVFTEQEAAGEISSFLSGVIENARGPVPFVGFNSFKFDVPFLRTVLIRNGINPYFRSMLVYRDLLWVARKLSATRADFPRVARKPDPDDEGPRLSLKLETLAQAFGVLEGAQAHSAREDVLVTIDVAKIINDRFGVDVRTFNTYEAVAAHSSARTGSLFHLVEPQYDLGMQGTETLTMATLLDADRRYALWVNLVRYAEGKGRRAISHYKLAGSGLQVRPLDNPPADSAQIALQALREFKEVNVGNYFTPTTCDIEIDIYRIDFAGIDAMHLAVWQGDRSAVKNTNQRDLNVLSVRHLLRSYEWGSGDDQPIRDRLRDYALYRYGGKLILSRSASTDPEFPDRTHSTLAERLAAIRELQGSADKQDAALLDSLERFYLESDIVSVAGDELLPATGAISGRPAA